MQYTMLVIKQYTFWPLLRPFTSLAVNTVIAGQEMCQSWNCNVHVCAHNSPPFHHLRSHAIPSSSHNLTTHTPHIHYSLSIIQTFSSFANLPSKRYINFSCSQLVTSRQYSFLCSMESVMWLHMWYVTWCVYRLRWWGLTLVSETVVASSTMTQVTARKIQQLYIRCEMVKSCVCACCTASWWCFLHNLTSFFVKSNSTVWAVTIGCKM